jgi:hypothetical protein
MNENEVIIKEIVAHLANFPVVISTDIVVKVDSSTITLICDDGVEREVDKRVIGGMEVEKYIRKRLANNKCSIYLLEHAAETYATENAWKNKERDTIGIFENGVPIIASEEIPKGNMVMLGKYSTTNAIASILYVIKKIKKERLRKKIIRIGMLGIGAVIIVVGIIIIALIKNPDWTKIGAIATIVGAIITFFGIFKDKIFKSI